MKLVGYTTNKPHTTAIVSAMLEHHGGELLPVEGFDGTLPDADWIVISGILRGCGMVYKACVEQKRNFLYVDHAYFNPGYEHPGWMRVSVNQHVFGPALEHRSDDRYARMFNRYKLEPWRGQAGGHVLVLPPTDAIGWLFDAREWQRDIIREIQRRTDLPIKVRVKPTNPIVDEVGNLIKMKNQAHLKLPSLAEDVAGAAAVVIYNSNSFMEVMAAGVPFICTENCAGYPISFDLDDLRDPARFNVEPNRAGLWADLAYNQFTLYEMSKGVPFTMLRL